MELAAASHVSDGDVLRAAVVEAVRRYLQDLPLTDPYRVALTAALAQPSNILSLTPDLRWARPASVCCVAAGGHWEQAIPIAVAAESFMVALDLLDDEEDGEPNQLSTMLGAACALNVSTGLLFLAQQVLLRHVGATGVAILLDAGLRACSGQHADLGATSDRLGTFDEALSITAGKSGSLVAAVCRIGAVAAGADSQVQGLYARFGYHLGIAAQLANDLRAVARTHSGKTDIALRRPTLPLTYAARSGVSLGDSTSASANLWRSGAAHFTWAVAETYRQYASGLIPSLTDEPARRADLAGLLHVL